MRVSIIALLVSAALGAVGGIWAFKKLQPKERQAVVACPQIQEDKSSTETRTVWRYKTKEGKPVVKEVVVVNTIEKKTAAIPVPERRKNIIGIQSAVDGKGNILVGPEYGRELFPNIYVTTGILATPKGQHKAVTVGVQISF